MMFKKDLGILPEIVSSILDILKELDGDLLKQDNKPNLERKNFSIVKRLKGGNWFSNNYINIIPGNKQGDCQENLLVIIDSNNNINNLLDKAIQHISNCPKTKYIIFYAAKWDSLKWIKKEKDFKNIPIILKLVGAEPLISD